LGDIADLERLVGRAQLGVATPRDLVALGRSLQLLPALADCLRSSLLAEIGGASAGSGGAREAQAGPREAETASTWASASSAAAAWTWVSEGAAGRRRTRSRASRSGSSVRLAGALASAWSAPCAATLPPRQGRRLRQPGISPELDELVAIASGGRDTITAIEAREASARHRLAQGKVQTASSATTSRSRARSSRTPRFPAEYVRKQTVANAERFVTPELAEYESKIFSADERRVALELEIFERLRARSRPRRRAYSIWRGASPPPMRWRAGRGGPPRRLLPPDRRRLGRESTSRMDVIPSSSGWRRRRIRPHDVHLDGDREQILIVTGPNMAGKSTLIRQVAHSVILAQMGSFVRRGARASASAIASSPAWGPATTWRVGESTFLVEMRETAHICAYATARSLVISTRSDAGRRPMTGCRSRGRSPSICTTACAPRPCSRPTITSCARWPILHPRVRNVSVAAREWKGLVFLRKLAPGGASRSFGIEVGKLAGLPGTVVERARAILKTLESDAAGTRANRPVPLRRRPPRSPSSGCLLASPWRLRGAPWASRPASRRPPGRVNGPLRMEVVAVLRAVDPDELSPRAALICSPSL